MENPGSEAGRLVLLMPTTSYRADAFLEAARRLGVEVVAASDRCHVLAKEWGVPLALDFRDPHAAARDVAAYARAHAVRAVVPIDDKTTLIAALACRELGLAHNPPEAALAARDKLRMREALRAAGVPAPRFEAFPIGVGERDLRARVETCIGYPCVVKPLALAASRGVMRADDARQLASRRERLAAILSAPDIEALHPGASRQFLVEEYVPGDEFALEGLLEGGRLRTLALFDKPDPLEGPFFEETIYTTPSRRAPEIQERLRACAAEAVKALGLREGAVHAELRWDPRPGANGPRVIEVAGRSIGGLCSRTLRFGVGMSLEELILRHALGMDVGAAERERRAAGVMMIPIPRAGVLQKVDGVDEARTVPGVETVEITAALEHVILPLPEGSSYLGFIVARADVPEEVERALRRAHALLRFTITPSIPLEKTLY